MKKKSTKEHIVIFSDIDGILRDIYPALYQLWLKEGNDYVDQIEFREKVLTNENNHKAISSILKLHPEIYTTASPLKSTINVIKGMVYMFNIKHVYLLTTIPPISNGKKITDNWIRNNIPFKVSKVYYFKEGWKKKYIPQGAVLGDLNIIIEDNKNILLDLKQQIINRGKDALGWYVLPSNDDEAENGYYMGLSVI